MMSIENIVDESGILLAKDAIEAGIPKYILYRYIKEKSLKKWLMEFMFLRRHGKIISIYYLYVVPKVYILTMRHYIIMA